MNNVANIRNKGAESTKERECKKMMGAKVSARGHSSHCAKHLESQRDNIERKSKKAVVDIEGTEPRSAFEQIERTVSIKETQKRRSARGYSFYCARHLKCQWEGRK